MLYSNRNLSLGLLAACLLFLSACGSKGAIIAITVPQGEMKVRLYDETPAHRDTFLSLVRKGYYDGLLFHRVVDDFVMQGGDPKSKTAGPETELGSSGKDFKVDSEISDQFIHKKGAVGFANVKVLDSSSVSVGGQFYIVEGKKINNGEMMAIQKKFGKTYSDEQKEVYGEDGGLPHLDGRNTVFGEVVKGIEVLEKISKLPTNLQTERPLEDIKMTITIVKEPK